VSAPTPPRPAGQVIRDFGKARPFPRGVLVDVGERLMLLHDKDRGSLTAISPIPAPLYLR
jgi:hypothetical protein